MNQESKILIFNINEVEISTNVIPTLSSEQWKNIKSLVEFQINKYEQEKI